jgi:hypothetical protein
MDKHDIDIWFLDNSKKIKEMIYYYKWKNNKTFDVSDMYSDLYLYLIDKKDTIRNIEAITYDYIMSNSYWYTSSINKDYKTDKDFKSTESIENFKDLDIEDEVDLNLDRKLLVEKRIELLHDFKNSLVELDERIFFNRYIEILEMGEKPTVRRFKKEFDIKHYQSWEYLNTLKVKLNEFIIKNNYNR